MKKERMKTEQLVFISQDILGEQCLKLEWQKSSNKKKKQQHKTTDITEIFWQRRSSGQYSQKKNYFFL